MEIIYFSSVLYKFTQGGYLPLAFSLVLVAMMGVWHYVHQRRYMFELNNKVSSDYVRDLAKNQNISRIPGIGLLYSELVQGIPPIFSHFISNIPSIHSVIVVVSVKSIPISKVVVEERFLFRQVEPRDYRMFRCVVRYGYNDKIEEPKEFERQLVENLKEFIRQENFILEGGSTEQMRETVNIQHSGLLRNDDKARRSSSSAVHVEEALENQIPSRISSSSIQSFNIAKSTNSSSRITPVPLQGAEEEMQFVQKEMEHGVFYFIGETEVLAEQDSSLLKKFVVNYAYSFLRKNFREGEKTLAIPRTRLLRVGMTYEI
ncbi:Potassium transporter 5 [Forsythia ovata]|uniref:Potassium transporter 5 n=1 Tax=Forsythia ovata TaxID=205694 RepID=A0ABD1QB61_9LAMI